jgi:hypothetical protein
VIYVRIFPVVYVRIANCLDRILAQIPVRRCIWPDMSGMRLELRLVTGVEVGPGSTSGSPAGYVSVGMHDLGVQGVGDYHVRRRRHSAEGCVSAVLQEPL